MKKEPRCDACNMPISQHASAHSVCIALQYERERHEETRATLKDAIETITELRDKLVSEQVAFEAQQRDHQATRTALEVEQGNYQAVTTAYQELMDRRTEAIKALPHITKACRDCGIDTDGLSPEQQAQALAVQVIVFQNQAQRPRKELTRTLDEAHIAHDKLSLTAIAGLVRSHVISLRAQLARLRAATADNSDQPDDDPEEETD